MAGCTALLLRAPDDCGVVQRYYLVRVHRSRAYWSWMLAKLKAFWVAVQVITKRELCNKYHAMCLSLWWWYYGNRVTRYLHNIGLHQSLRLSEWWRIQILSLVELRMYDG